MARAQGARSQIAAAFETVYGTAPAGGFTRMPFASTSLGAEQPLLNSELLGYGRDPLAPIKDAVTADGDVVVPLDAEAFGFGEFPGQYGMVVYSKFPIDVDAVRTFQNFRWQDMPGNLLPTDFYDEQEQAILRLSSKSHWDVPIQVEVESHEQAFEALDAGVDFLMIDNMAPAPMAALVSAIRAAEPTYGRVWIEATGGLTVESVREVAQTGVDFMSVGALTHSSPIIDIGLDLA